MMTIEEVKKVLEEQVTKQENKIAELQRKIDHLDSWGPMWWDKQEASEHTHYTREVREIECVIDNIKNAIDDLWVFKKLACEFDIEVHKTEVIRKIGDDYFNEIDTNRVLVAYSKKNGYSRGFEQNLCDEYQWIKY